LCPIALNWSVFITLSKLQLAPLLELLIKTVLRSLIWDEVQLLLQAALVNAAHQSNGCGPANVC